ncbi:MAG TPA: ATP-binding protein [Chryseolinea sp.]
MQSFFDKLEFDQSDIENLIKTNAEESINFELKSSDSLDRADGKKNEISKDVASFANSAGGIIIYGVLEKDHKADQLVFVDGNDYSKEWLEQVINSKIQKRIPDLKIFPVRFGGDVAKTVYVVKIPASVHAPHMSADKRFYKRFNFQSVPMEEYEVRDLFDRKQRTDVEIDDILVIQKTSMQSMGRLTYANYQLGFQLRNVGNTIEERFKLEIHIPGRLLDGVQRATLGNKIVRELNDIVVVSIPSSSPLYQDEMTTVASIEIKVSRSVVALLSEPGILVKTYYSNGIKEKVFNLFELLSYEGKYLKDIQWN